MSLTTQPFDAARHFSYKEEQTRLLNDALSSHDASYVVHALETIVRARSVSQLTETSVSHEALYAQLSQNGNPFLDTILKVTRALGLELRAS